MYFKTNLHSPIQQSNIFIHLNNKDLDFFFEIPSNSEEGNKKNTAFSTLKKYRISYTLSGNPIGGGNVTILL